MPASSFSLTQTGSGKSVQEGGTDLDLIDGHCAFGLEHLCLKALDKSSGHSASINIARILVKDGSPMHVVDPKSLQVGSLSCIYMYGMML